jgi:hypothetical protein
MLEEGSFQALLAAGPEKIPALPSQLMEVAASAQVTPTRMKMPAYHA